MVFGLRRLSPMERPRLARAWIEALADTPATGDVADALRLACALLDTPLPQHANVELSA